MDVRNVIIIGAGAAGWTAAIYTARANLNPLVFEGMQPGGQLTITTEVENFPGFEHGIMGPELMDTFKKQALRFGTESIFGEVTAVDFSQRPFKITGDDDNDYYAKSVIVATGASAKFLGLESEKRLMGFGVSACATCDGAFFKDREVIVVGGGDTAIEEATFLTRFAAKVYIIHRRDELRASKIMQERAFKNEKIEFIWDTVVDDILGDRNVTSARLKNVKTNELKEMPIDGVFLGIGHKPNTDLFKGILDMDDVGYLITKPKSTKTNIDGVFAAGDVQDSYYRQAVSAAGSGCMAAIDAERWLEAQEG